MVAGARPAPWRQGGRFHPWAGHLVRGRHAAALGTRHNPSCQATSWRADACHVCCRRLPEWRAARRSAAAVAGQRCHTHSQVGVPALAPAELMCAFQAAVDADLHSTAVLLFAALQPPSACWRILWTWQRATWSCRTAPTAQWGRRAPSSCQLLALWRTGTCAGHPLFWAII